MDYLELFAGAGGGILAHSKLLGHRPVGYAEKAAFPARVLQARIARGYLPRMRAHDDVCGVRGRDYAGVHLVSGGFPCQDVSAASGTTIGVDGARSGLVFEMLRIVGEARPKYIFAENSPHLRTKGLGRILEALNFLGYGDVVWIVLGAGDVGAPHLRKRMWLLAKQSKTSSATVGLPASLPANGRLHRGGVTALPAVSRSAHGKLPTLIGSDASAAGNRKSASAWSLSDVLGITKKAERHGLRLPTLVSSDYRHPGSQESRDRLRGLRSRPLRETLANIEGGGKVINPTWAEWFMGWPLGWTDLADASPGVAAWRPTWTRGSWWTDAVEAVALPRTLHARNAPDISSRIKALGNGQVPVCAAVAYITLLELLP